MTHQSTHLVLLRSIWVRSLSRVSRSLSFVIIDSQAARAGLCALLLAAALVVAPQALFAQHGSGGGSHAGAGFGGGGFGGGHSSGGGFGGGHSSPSSSPSHSSPPPSSRPASAPVAHPAAAAQPVRTFAPPSSSTASSATPSATGGSSSSNAVHPVIHAPFTPVVGSGDSNSVSQSAGATSGGQGIAVNRTTGPLSFSGQGHEIWQDRTRSGSATPTPRTTAGSFGTRPLEGSLPRGNPPGRIFFPPTYYPGFYPGFGFYGGGFGLGFGAFGCNPFSIWGCGLYGYGWGNGFGNGFGYNNYYSPYYGFGATPSPAPSSDYYQQDTPATPSSEYTIPYTYEPPPGPQNPPDVQVQQDSSEQKNGVVVYLTNGQVYLVRDYWIAGGQLHYRTADGGENAVDWNKIDVQKTVDVNARRGVNFTLRPSDDPQSDSAPSLEKPAPDAPDSSRAPDAPANTPPDSAASNR